jgi:hypothetical protein
MKANEGREPVSHLWPDTPTASTQQHHGTLSEKVLLSRKWSDTVQFKLVSFFPPLTSSCSDFYVIPY